MSGANQEVDNDSVPSVYEWAGGAAAFEKLTAMFYRHALEEQLLKPLFENMPPEHSHRVAMWIAEIFGGPKSYSGRFDKDTAHPHMMSRYLGVPEKSPMPKWGWGEVKPLINASGSENKLSKEKQEE